MEKQTKPAPDAALRCARASLLLSSLRRPHAPQDRRTSSPIPSVAAEECAQLRSSERLLAAARREAVVHARIAGSQLLLVLGVALVVALLLLILLLGLL